jgi:hypothetical protein
MNNIIPVGKGEVLGVDRVDQYITVYYGYIREHKFNLVQNKYCGSVVYTMYLDGDTKHPCFKNETEEVTKNKIQEMLNGR